MLERMRAKARANTRVPGLKCAVCTLPAETLEVVRQLRAEGIPNTVLSRTLVAEGHPIGRGAVSRHFLDHESGG